MAFTVTAIVDGDTFRVNPGWKYDNKEGDTVRANGYNTPEKGQPGYEEAKERLEELISGKEVEFKNAVGITYERLLCDVYFSGNNLKDYFPQYQ